MNVTKEMIEAAKAAENDFRKSDILDIDKAYATIFQAMLAAAPKREFALQDDGALVSGLCKVIEVLVDELAKEGGQYYLDGYHPAEIIPDDTPKDIAIFIFNYLNSNP